MFQRQFYTLGKIGNGANGSRGVPSQLSSTDDLSKHENENTFFLNARKWKRIYILHNQEVLS